MSEQQDLPGGRPQGRPGDRPVAGMPRDDAGRAAGSPVERPVWPADGGPAKAAGTTARPTGPANGADGRGLVPGPRETADRDGEPAFGATDRDRDLASDSADRDRGLTARTADREGTSTDTVRERTSGSQGMIQPDGGAGAVGERALDGSAGTRPAAGEMTAERLIGQDDAGRFESRWREVKAGFVDDPRDSVGRADALCDEIVRALTTALGEQRQELQRQWHGDADTERMRTALCAYGVLLERLISL